MRGNHVAHPTPSPTRSPAARRARRVAQAGLVAALVAGFVGSTGAVATASPQRVLQAVDVHVGPDGTIASIASTEISKSSDGSDSTTQTFDPATTAHGLPVRILTSYRLGNQAGTDLSDIVGKSGRVVVQMTVQNTTVRPRMLSYDVAGAERHQYALVGTPLTVVASADLGSGSLGRVITGDGSGGTQVTNGVLSQGSTGSSQVQWSALLAPPRLSPSVTFTLVEQTADFQVPDVDFSVQPGLVTDPSVQALLNSAFSQDQDSTLKMESDTISLISQVNTVLTSAGAVLGRIQNNLGSTAGQLGRQTITQLHTSSALVTSSVTTLSKNLAALQTQMRSTLDSGNQSVLSSLTQRLSQIKKVLGSPQTAQHLTVDQQDSCAVPVVHGFSGQKASVFDRLLLVKTQLGALRSTSHRCGALIEQAMDRSIGTASCDPASYAGRAMPATCVLASARDTVSDEAGAMVHFQQELLGLYDHQTVSTLGDQLTTLTGSVFALQNKADTLTSNGNQASQVRSQLTSMQTGLRSLSDALGKVSLSTITADFSQIKTIADTQLDSLGNPGDPTSEQGQAADLAALVTQSCTGLGKIDVPGLALLAGPLKDLLDQLTSGCSPQLLSEATSLVTGLQASQQAWSDVAEAADGGNDIGDAAGAINDLKTKVGTLLDSVDTALSPGQPLDLLTDDLATIQQQSNALYDANDHPGSCSAPSVKAGEDPLNALSRSVQSVACTSKAIDSSVDNTFARINASLASSSTLVSSSIASTDQARRDAESSVSGLTATLGSQLQTSGTAIVASGNRQLQVADGQLDSYESGFASKLDQTTASALGQIASSVGASDRNLDASRRGLTDSLGNVLADLGDRRDNGTGLLGELVTDATQTGVSSQRIGDASDRAASFGSIKSQQLDDVYLQEAQLQRSFELQQLFPAFGIDLPAGSTHLTVFAFHLGADA